MKQKTSSNAAAGGIGFGSALALVLSMHLVNSIPWAILHGILGWFYVLYRWLWAGY